MSSKYNKNEFYSSSLLEQVPPMEDTQLEESSEVEVEKKSIWQKLFPVMACGAGEFLFYFIRVLCKEISCINSTNFL